MSSRTPSYPSGHAPGPSGSRKVAIPRLQRTGQMSDSPRDRRRVSRACTACRSHKIKCSGDSPQCKHCVATGRECIYIMPRRDRLKIITERCVQMATLLRTLRGWASEEDSARIGELLDAVDEDVSDIPQTPVPSNPDTDGDDSGTGFSGNMRWFSEQVNLDALDLLDENLHENDRSRATGFMGMNSEVQWLRTFLINERLDDKSAREPTPDRRIPFAVAGNSEQVSGVTFYLDSDNVDLDFYVEPYGLPAPEIAEKLLATYMDKVHVSFPILPRRLFEDQFRRYFKGWTHGSPPRLNPKWQAILNLVFAIAAKYTHLVKANWRADERDHLIYQARARTFGWNDATLTQHPDLPQIQVAGLLAFYYLSVGQVSRAWVTVGVALRFANALGLHVRNEDPSASSPKKEVLVRVWWSLYSLERQLSVITGRPSVIVDSCCSVPLPLPLPEEQIPEEADVSSGMRRESLASTASSVSNSPTMRNPYSMSGELLWKSTGPGNGEPNSGSYFRAVVQIGIITQNILSSLYTAGTMIRAPGEIHQDIIQLGKRVDQWMSSLPSELNFQIPSAGVSTPLRAYYRERTLLGFQYCSARILLTRPCLGGLIPSQKPGKEGSMPASFLRQMANICVEAAKTEIGLLPDRPDPLFVYENAPWWSIVHHLMQAFAVLLLALSGSPSAVRDHDTLGNYAKKTLRWLSAMSDPLAERAFKVAMHSFAIVAKRLSLDVSDLRVEYGLASLSSVPNMADQSFLEPGTFSESASRALGSSGHVFTPIPASAPQMAGPPFHGFDASTLGSLYSSQTDEMRYDESFYDHRN